jgi:hypothetical protein
MAFDTKAYQKEYQRKWKAANPDYHRNWTNANPEYKAQWAADNPELAKKYQLANKDSIRIRARELRNTPEGKQRQKATMERWRQNNPLTAMLGVAKTSARTRGCEFNLTAEDFLPLPTKCPVFGVDLIYKDPEKIRHPNMASFDRIDSSQGYIRGNVVIISWRANRIKNNATPEELQQLADFYNKKKKEQSQCH